MARSLNTYDFLTPFFDLFQIILTLLIDLKIKN